MVLTRDTLPYYLGGFLGPFGTMIVLSIYPELRESFDASTSAVNWAFSGYMLPMAVLLLVSGTIGERFGRRRVTRITFVVYAVASIAAAFAPTLGLFLAARVVQGVANAFITPLLIAGLTEVTPADRLGRAVGVYSSFQAGGAAVAPFVGGVIANVDWRLGFVVVAVIALALSTRPPDGEPRPAAAAPPITPLLTRRMSLLWVGALSAAAGPVGIAVLVGLLLRDELDTSSGVAGAVLLLSGLSAMVLGPTWGRLVDAWGSVRACAVATVAVTASTAPLGLLDSVTVLAIAWVVGGAFVGFVVVNLQHLAALAVPDNRGGALSSVLSFRFLGHAIGPLVWVPLFDRSVAVAFAGAGGLGLVSAAALVAAARSAPAATLPPLRPAR